MFLFWWAVEILIIPNTSHARCHQREVPDAGQIGRTIYNSMFVVFFNYFPWAVKILIIHDRTHARCRQREVPDGGHIGRTICNSCFFVFIFFPVSSENPNYTWQDACAVPPKGGPGRRPNWPYNIQFYVFCCFVFFPVSSENPNYT